MFCPYLRVVKDRLNFGGINGENFSFGTDQLSGSGDSKPKIPPTKSSRLTQLSGGGWFLNFVVRFTQNYPILTSPHTLFDIISCFTYLIFIFS